MRPRPAAAARNAAALSPLHGVWILRQAARAGRVAARPPPRAPACRPRGVLLRRQDTSDSVAKVDSDARDGGNTEPAAGSRLPAFAPWCRGVDLRVARIRSGTNFDGRG